MITLGIYETNGSIRKLVSRFLNDRELVERYAILPNYIDMPSLLSEALGVIQLDQLKSQFITDAQLAIVEISAASIPALSFATGYLRTVLPPDSKRKLLVVSEQHQAIHAMWSKAAELEEHPGRYQHILDQHRLWLGVSLDIPLLTEFFVPPPDDEE